MRPANGLCLTIMALSAALPEGVLYIELTESERGVLRLMAQRVNNQTIAHRLGLSPKAVRNYVSSIFGKLQVADRAQAIVRARRAGLE